MSVCLSVHQTKVKVYLVGLVGWISPDQQPLQILEPLLSCIPLSSCIKQSGWGLRFDAGPGKAYWGLGTKTEPGKTDWGPSSKAETRKALWGPSF